MSSGREALMVFARFPEPGRTKTRLIPRLGPEKAALAYRRIAEETARQAARLDRPDLERVAWIEPPSRVTDASVWLGPSFAFRPQPEGDLGARLAAAFASAFDSGAARAVAIGTDCPGLGAVRLGRAFDALATHDGVIGPTQDGGYYLIGLARSIPAAFEKIPWSTAEVGRITNDRLLEAAASVCVLDTLRDLDTPEDLDALASRWPELLGDLVDR